MTEANNQATITAALQRLKDATDRHNAAMKTLEDFDHIIGRVRNSPNRPNPIPVTSWEIAIDHSDMRYDGGIKVGGAAPTSLAGRAPRDSRLDDGLAGRCGTVHLAGFRVRRHPEELRSPTRSATTSVSTSQGSPHFTI